MRFVRCKIIDMQMKARNVGIGGSTGLSFNKSAKIHVLNPDGGLWCSCGPISKSLNHLIPLPNASAFSAPAPNESAAVESWQSLHYWTTNFKIGNK